MGAISGVTKLPFVIDGAKCIKCGACAETCSFGAVKEAS
ncbi:MAG: 4Fe-4S binding protein [Treponema sp.]|nr:4Fe-4S binding protein [Treponema sp.]